MRPTRADTARALRTTRRSGRDTHGAFAAILLILLFLPGVLALFDRWVLPRALRRQLYPPKARGAQSAKQEHKI